MRFASRQSSFAVVGVVCSEHCFMWHLSHKCGMALAVQSAVMAWIHLEGVRRQSRCVIGAWNDWTSIHVKHWSRKPASHTNKEWANFRKEGADPRKMTPILPKHHTQIPHCSSKKFKNVWQAPCIQTKTHMTQTNANEGIKNNQWQWKTMTCPEWQSCRQLMKMSMAHTSQRHKCTHSCMYAYIQQNTWICLC